MKSLIATDKKGRLKNMATPIIMPRQGQSVESCIITKWHKKKGDVVKAGDILFSYETDKASFDEESKVVGIMLDTFFEEGDDVPCLLNVCAVGEKGESAAEFDPSRNDGNQASEPVLTTSDLASEPANSETVLSTNKAQSILDVMQNLSELTKAQNTDNGMIRISPRAKKLSEKIGVDYRYAEPTGPYGRIIEKDIITLSKSGALYTASALAEQMKSSTAADAAGTGIGGRITTGDISGETASEAAPAATLAASAARPTATAGMATVGVQAAGQGEPLYEEVKISNIRKVIAKAMHHSLSSMAQLTLSSSFDATNILEFRRRLKENKERLGLENITINDIIIYAVSRTLTNHRDLNAHFLDDRILYFKNANVGVAVDTERGLMVPTLFDANLKSLNSISSEVRMLVNDCKAGSINPDFLKNGSFTVTNLGTLDIESFTPVINPPQTGILGVNNIVQRAKEKDGEYEFYPAMGLSLTFDHRAVDGAPAARFLKELKTNLENFSLMLVK